MVGKYVKKGAYNTFFLGLYSLITRGISFLFLPFFLNHLSLEEFGIWELYQSFFSLSSLLLASTSSICLTRFFLLYSDDYSRQKKVVSNSVFMIVIGTIFFCFLGGFLFYYTFDHHINLTYGLFTFISVCLFSSFSLVLSFFKVQEQLFFYGILFCGQSLIATMLTVLGIWYGYGIESFFCGMLISLFLCLPFFLYLLFSFCSYDFSLLKKQLYFSIPLVMYSGMYSFLFVIDRWFIKAYMGNELLGVYGLLFRFGALFQFIAIALMDASPVVFFNAQKETESQDLLKKLFSYVILILVTANLFFIVSSQWVIQHWFPEKYWYLIHFIPFFFVPLVILEIGRFLQTSFSLANKTYPAPFILGITLCLQTFFLGIGGTNLYLVFFANGLAFLCYMALCYVWTIKLRINKIIPVKKILISIILYCFFLFLFLIYRAFFTISFFASVIFFFLWVLCVLFSGIIDTEDITNGCTRIFNFFIGKRMPEIVQNISFRVSEHVYTKSFKRKRIVVLGPKSPPIGGVSVHIDRSIKILEKQNNTLFHFDTTCRSRIFIIYLARLFIYIITLRPDVIIYHTPYTEHGIYEYLTLILAHYFLKYSIIAIEHDCRYLDYLSQEEKNIFNFCLQFVEKQVFIGDATIQSYVKNCISIIDNHSVETAFIPPDISQKNILSSLYPKDLFSFMESHSPILLINGFQMSLLKDQDLYGFNMAIQLIEELRINNSSIGLICVLAQIGNDQYFTSLQANIKNKKLQSQIYWLIGKNELWPLFEKVDIFLRPTLSDNDGVSIHEAIYFNTKTIASDVCTRAQGTILFEKNNYTDLKAKVLGVLSDEKKGLYEFRKNQEQSSGLLE